MRRTYFVKDKPKRAAARKRPPLANAFDSYQKNLSHVLTATFADKYKGRKIPRGTLLG